VTLAFDNFDVSDFWDNSEFALRNYVGGPLTDEVLRRTEERLQHKLPASYVELMRVQNGGMPRRTCHRTTTRTTWAADHVAVTGIYGIGVAPENSLGGVFGHEFWLREWGYPSIGVYFADCPSAGHDMICFDYRACGREGEPSVAHVDQEVGYTITQVAPNFESFVRGLKHESDFPD
jgi:hypothetical protein